MAFLEGFAAFDYAACPKALRMDHLDLATTCFLSDVGKPLQWVSDHLQKKVRASVDSVTHLKQEDGLWRVLTASGAVHASHAVLMALGGEPRVLDHVGEMPAQFISLEVALNPQALASCLSPQNKVAVWGASHSAVLALKNCLDLKVPVVHFYRGPVQYAVEEAQGIFNDNTGLKGSAADWARAHLHGQHHPLLTSVAVRGTDDAVQAASCSHRIEAVGFRARMIPVEGFPSLTYDLQTGMFAPGLFGLGLSAPIRVRDAYDRFSLDVGLFKFMKHIRRLLPLWQACVL